VHAAPDEIYEAFVLSEDVFYARPHLFPLPQERTLLQTIFKHLDAGRANTADGEWEVRRRTIRLLLGEKAGMRAVLKTNRRTKKGSWKNDTANDTRGGVTFQDLINAEYRLVYENAAYRLSCGMSQTPLPP